MLWSRKDHPRRIDLVGKVALVVKPKVKGFWLSKALMDGGSSLNIMYYDTYIQRSKMTFHGIVPRRKAYSLGQVVLDVPFGSEENFP
jgi:hypothetical protein